MNATKAMIDAVMTVSKSDRKLAALLAEQTYFRHYARNLADGDFSTAECAEMASEAAAAEVYFHFA